MVGEPWYHRAACKGLDGLYDMSTVERPLHEAPLATWQAIAVCSLCPVARACLTDAFTPLRYFMPNTERDMTWPVLGVLGGTTPQDRAGHTVDDVDDLLARSRENAVALGIAPRWILTEAA